MGKPGAIRKLVSRLLEVRVTTAVLCFLCLVTVIKFFTTAGTTNYTTIPISSLDRKIYKERNPHLVHNNKKPDCDLLDIIQETIDTWEIPKKFDDFSPAGLVNGSYTPSECNAQVSVAILVTYRNRQKQLDVFLPYIHNFLRKQNIHYKIYLIEQQDEKPWNKGMLYNIGAKYAMAEKFPCLILHDVDLLPLDMGNLYACLTQPHHLSAAVDKLRYVLVYPELVGGVLAIRSDQYTAVNGFSNSYEGWGGEDDDFYFRMIDEGLSVLRLPISLSRYHMVPHAPAKVNTAAGKKVRKAKAKGREGREYDGLRTAAYSTLRLAPHRLFTLIGVKL